MGKSYLKVHFDEILISGGAGFIGSHLIDGILRMPNVSSNLLVIYNLSNGSLKNVERWKDDARFQFVRQDLLTISI